jgi:hypothetical protein
LRANGLRLRTGAGAQKQTSEAASPSFHR